MHQLDVCGIVALNLSGFVRRNRHRFGYDARMERHNGWSPAWGIDDLHYGGLRYHTYVVLNRSDQPEDIIVEPTWQQFLLAAKIPVPDDAPKVLFGTSQQVVEQAQRYGITSPNILKFWRNLGATSLGGA